MTAPLSSTVTALLSSVLDSVPEGASIRVTSFTADIPADATLAHDATGAPAVLVGPPQWRWRTDFDRTPGRLRMTVDLLTDPARADR